MFGRIDEKSQARKLYTVDDIATFDSSIMARFPVLAAMDRSDGLGMTRVCDTNEMATDRIIYMFEGQKWAHLVCYLALVLYLVFKRYGYHNVAEFL